MPRRRTLTGRSERERNRNAQFQRDEQNRVMRRNVNRVNDHMIDILSDRFKIAVYLVPRNFESYHIGSMDVLCNSCNAKHFTSEITGQDRHLFTLCCHKGKVHLPPLAQNAFFNGLYYGLSSADQTVKERSKNYFDKIRSYNSAFAMISSEAKVSDTMLQGIYHFKIHDIFYHRTGPMAVGYGFAPRYAQLYFYDVDTAVNMRMREQSNQQCDGRLMREIAVQLEGNNPFVRSFHTMHEYCERVENVQREVCMVIKVNRDFDIRRYNDAVQTDVAVIFNTIDGEPPFERNMVAFPKVNGTVRNVSVLDSSLDPLAYPLLFPNGDTGWHVNMIHNIPSMSTAAAPRTKVTMLQYAAYRLANRNNFSLLHHSQKLFLQWVVDMYVRIEGTRLHFIKQNQANLRSEIYSNLTAMRLMEILDEE